MNIVENKKIVRAFYESYNEGDLDESFERYIAKDVVLHTVDDSFDREKWLAFDKSVLDATSNTRFKVVDQVCEGDTVWTRWTTKSFHTGEFMGMSPTGNEVRMEAISIDIVANGKIVNHLAVSDFSAYLKQFAGK